MTAAIQLYSPVGHCIYCLSTVELSDEHIIPLALNGTQILPKASCKECATITSQFERIVARTIYGDLRTKLGFKTRHKKKRPKQLPVQFTTPEGGTHDTQLLIKDYPIIYAAVKFPPPGILTGAPHSDMNPEMTIQIKSDKEQIAQAIQNIGQENILLSSNFHWGPFCRQLAKIAHAYLVAIIGTEGYKPLLIDIVLGKSNYLSHLVGGVETKTSLTSSDLSLILISDKGVNYLVVYIQLLGAGRLPLYQAVAGVITDMNMVISKVIELKNSTR